jgi:hypothetical protein
VWFKQCFLTSCSVSQWNLIQIPGPWCFLFTSHLTISHNFVPVKECTQRSGTSTVAVDIFCIVRPLEFLKRLSFYSSHCFGTSMGNALTHRNITEMCSLSTSTSKVSANTDYIACSFQVQWVSCSTFLSNSIALQFGISRWNKTYCANRVLQNTLLQYTNKFIISGTIDVFCPERHLFFLKT